MSLNIAWMDHAACAGHPDPDLFFPTADNRLTHKARAICATCPVTAQCSTFQHDTGSEGVWGNQHIKVKDGKRPDTVKLRAKRANR
ncbi:WhiB family transcriptional regulator [Mycolicibacterium gilvum]|uniref:WhiB family transcriptional regulator n=1 Tax=Mycolicibacterium gilvum TaxID=1804 RepID=UPI0040455BC3